jgi:molecular chaperone DnaJ
MNGTEMPLEIPRQEPCSTCHGSGAKPGTSPKTCTECRGTGQVRYRQGFFSFSQTCPRCSGRGEIIDTPCPTCRGAGRVRGTNNVTVRIPPGVDEGTTLRVAGSGDAGEQGSVPGDLYVIVHLKSDPRFSRRGDDLHTEATIGFPEAVFGSEVDVATLNGKVKLKVPQGTQPSTTFRVREEGFPRLGRRGRGDLLVKVTIEVPKSLTETQKAALRQFAEAMGYRAGSGGSDTIFKKVFG